MTSEYWYKKGYEMGSKQGIVITLNYLLAEVKDKEVLTFEDIKKFIKNMEKISEEGV